MVKGKLNNYGTGSLQINSKTNELFIITWAHIFVKTDEAQPIKLNSNLEFADKATFILNFENITE